MILKSLFAVSAFMLILTSATYALPEYAEQTHQKCGYCHIDPSGGGILTIDGMGFAATKFKKSLSHNNFPKKMGLG